MIKTLLVLTPGYFISKYVSFRLPIQSPYERQPSLTRTNRNLSKKRYNFSCINRNVFCQMILKHFLHDFGNLTLLSLWLFTYQNALGETLVSWNCQWGCQKQNATACVFLMNWRSDLLRISHKTFRAPEMLSCLHLWSLSNLLRIASVLRESSTLRCCLHYTG